MSPPSAMESPPAMSPPSSMVSPSAAASHTPAEAAPAASSSTPTQSHRRAKSSPLTSTTQYAGLSLTKYVRVPAIAVRHIVGHVVNGPRVPQWTVVDSVMVGVTRWLLTGGEAMVEYVDDLWLAGALDRPEDYDEDVEIYDERGVAIVRGDAAAVAVAAQRTVAEETVQKTTQSDSAADVAAVEFAKFQVGPALTADSDNGPNTTSDIVKKRGNAVHPLSDLATKQDINAVTASSVATSPASMTALSVSPPQLSPSSLAASLPVAPRSSSAYGLRVLRKVLRRRFRINRLSVVDQKLLNMMAQRPLSSSSDAFHPLAERYHEVMSTTLPTASATTADPWTWNVPMKHLKYRVEPVRNIQRMDQLLRNIYTYKRPNFFPVRNPDYAPFMGRCHGHEEASASATGDALHPGAHAILYEDFPKHDPRRHSFTGPFCRDDGEMMYAEWTVFEAADNAPESVRTVVPSKEECKVVLYFHGGAMIFMQPQGFRAGAQHVAKYTGARVFVIDNRLAPEHMYPDPLYDAIAAYVHLIRVEGYRPDQIFFMGDSAGGNLTFAAALFLLDHHEALCAALGMSKEELGRPAGIIGSSPWLDLSNSLPSHSLNEKTDYLQNAHSSHLTSSPIPNVSFAYWGGIEAVTEGWPLSRPEKPVVKEEAAASCVIPWYRRFGSKKTSPPSPVDPELLVIRDRMQRKRDAFSKAIAAEKYLSPCMQREAFARPDMPPVLVLAGSAELLMSDAVAAYVNSIPAVEEKTGKTWRAIVDAFSHLLSDADFVSAKLLRGDTKTKPNVVAVTDVLVTESGLEIPTLPKGSARVELFLGRVHCFQVVPGSAARWSFARVGKWMANPERAKETGIVVHNV